jgi:hypothetical protein
MNIKLIVLDLDGTTVGPSNQIRLPVKQAIRAAKAQGIQVAIATGRMYRSALRFHQDIGSTLPLMAYQGALIKDPTTGELHQNWTIHAPLVLELLDYFEHSQWREAISVHLYSEDQLYVRQITTSTRVYAERSNIQPIALGDLRTLAAQSTKVLVLSQDTALIQTLLTDLRQKYAAHQLYLTTSVANFLEATHPKVNKGNAVRYLAEELLGLQAENVMAIGDNFNDLEMLQYAGIGVAMGDAPEGVKAVADWIAPTVEADGVAMAIDWLLRNEFVTKKSGSVKAHSFQRWDER